MSIDSAYLDEREQRARQNAHQADRDRAAREWMNRAQKPEVRLARFDAWLRLELAARLDWTWAGAHQEKRLEQCRIQIDGMVLDLWRRGWMLDGERLAGRIREMLDAIGKAQKGSQVRDFWPYFKAAVGRYVGLNAEEIREDAMHAGQAVADVFNQLLKRAPEGPALPELVAQRADETLRAKLTRQRAKDARKAAEKDQLRLL